MTTLSILDRIASAAAAFFGRYGDVTRLAQQQGTCRQAIYRQAHAVHDDLDADALRQENLRLRQQLDQLQARCDDLQRRLDQTPVVNEDRQAEFAATAQAEGVSLPVARRLLAVLMRQQTPSVAQLGRHSAAAARAADAALRVLDEASRPQVRQAAADELFVRRRPVLMVVEPDSLCWTTARLAEDRSGATWATELKPYTGLEQLYRDAGTGLEKGLQEINRVRLEKSEKAVADQHDHFHLLREGRRALRKLQGQANRALELAEKTQRALKRKGNYGYRKTGRATVAARRWRQAEAAFDAWSAGEAAWQRVRAALTVFTPEGELNTRTRAAAVIEATLPQLPGAVWAKTRRLLARPEVLTFLDRLEQSLPTGPLAEAALCLEGGRRRSVAVPEGRRGGAYRGLLLLSGLLLTLSAESGEEAREAVSGVLRVAWRGSSAVEGVNSVVRMQQARHRKLTQGLLDLKRLYWNCKQFRTGKRKKQSPYERLGLRLPKLSWWELLKLPPEQLKQQLSAPDVPS